MINQKIETNKLTNKKTKAILLIAVFILSTLTILPLASAVNGVTITSTDIQGPYVEDIPQEFSIRTTSTSDTIYTGALFTFEIKRLTDMVLTDIASLEYYDAETLGWTNPTSNPAEGTDTWLTLLPLTTDGSPVTLVGGFGPIPELANGYDVTSKFSVEFATADTYTITISLDSGGTITSTIFTVEVVAPGTLAFTSVPNSGPVETEATITGVGATPGGLVKVYWDAVKTWDGTSGYLDEVYANAIDPYRYSIDITIPESVEGVHGIVVKDMESSTLATTTYTVTPDITLTPTAGIIGDTITVTGTGYEEEEEITITYTGSIPLDTVPVEITTNAIGSFTASFVIPDGMEDPSYTIKATGTDSGESAETVLSVGTVVTLTPKTGLTGTTVTIVGRGFTPSKTVDIR